MKGFSIKQPWAWAIINLGKDIENRCWKTNYRGWIAIQAPIKVMDYDKDDFPHGSKIPKKEELVTASIVGVAYLSDCVEKSKSKWFHEPEAGEPNFGFVLTDIHKLKEPIECKGFQDFWEVPPSVKRKIKAQLPKLNFETSK